MGRYNWKIENMLYEEDVRKLFDAGGLRSKALIAILWLTGARPGEIVKLKLADLRTTQDRLFITLLTLKLKKRQKQGSELIEDGSFIPNRRTLEFERPKEQNIYIEAVITYAQCFSEPEACLFSYSTRWLEKTISELSESVLGHPVAPYHFRHSVFMWAAREGWSLDKIMYFKGSTNPKSAMSYIHAAPQLISSDFISNRKRIVEAQSQAVIASENKENKD